MLIYSFSDVIVLPLGSIQVMMGLGKPDARQVKVATAGDVTSWDEGYIVIVAGTATEI